MNFWQKEEEKEDELFNSERGAKLKSGSLMGLIDYRSYRLLTQAGVMLGLESTHFNQFIERENRECDMCTNAGALKLPTIQ